MGKHVFETDCECSACNGTGVYKGFAECAGAAVVCQRCSGTGKAHIKVEYSDFTGRKERKGIVRVYETNPGFGLGPDGPGGMSYADWFRGQAFPRGSELRDKVCPRWWWQSAGAKPPEPECADFCCGLFTECRHFGTKAACWAKWDAARNGSKS